MSDEKRCDRCQFYDWTTDPQSGVCTQNAESAMTRGEWHCDYFQRRNESRPPSEERRQAWRGQ